MKKIGIVILLLMLVFVLATVIKYYKNVSSRIIMELDYCDSTNTLTNPDRGWYTILSCMVKDNYSDADELETQIMQQKLEGDTLSLVLFNLSNYKDSSISDKGLQYISKVLEQISEAEMKAIIRFVYDWDGMGLEREPKDINTILLHMEQVADIVNKNKDSVYLVQGIFAGSYGEMHSSNYISDENIKLLIKQLLSKLDEQIFIAVRTPAFWRLYNNTVDKGVPYIDFSKTRIGLYNDGLNSSAIDLGTYSENKIQDRDYVSKWSRQQEIKFQSELCNYVPNGGEIAIENVYNDLEIVLKEFPKVHISYLNREYNQEVYKKWKNTIYKANKLEDPYQGLDGYKYIQDHLGYRYVLRGVTKQKYSYLGFKIKIEVAIENTGFSNLYYSKNTELILNNKATKETMIFTVPTDIRKWNAQEVTIINIDIPTKDLKEDTYDIYLKIQDNNKSCIQLANNNIYNSRYEANYLGELTMTRLSLKNILFQ